MKKLDDGTEVTDRSYYYLLDWNDWNEKKFMRENFNKSSLQELNILEYEILFSIATNQEFPKESDQPTIIMFGSGITKAQDYLQLLEKAKGAFSISPWDDSAYFTGKLLEEPPLLKEMIHDPFVQRRNKQNIGFIGHLLPTTAVSDLPLLERPPKIDYDMFVKNNYEFNPKTGKSSHVRGEKNKDFKQSIKNLTNNRK